MRLDLLHFGLNLLFLQMTFKMTALTENLLLEFSLSVKKTLVLQGWSVQSVAKLPVHMLPIKNILILI